MANRRSPEINKVKVKYVNSLPSITELREDVCSPRTPISPPVPQCAPTVIGRYGPYLPRRIPRPEQSPESPETWWQQTPRLTDPWQPQAVSSPVEGDYHAVDFARLPEHYRENPECRPQAQETVSDWSLGCETSQLINQMEQDSLERSCCPENMEQDSLERSCCPENMYYDSLDSPRKIPIDQTFDDSLERSWRDERMSPDSLEVDNSSCFNEGFNQSFYDSLDEGRRPLVRRRFNDSLEGSWADDRMFYDSLEEGRRPLVRRRLFDPQEECCTSDGMSPDSLEGGDSLCGDQSTQFTDSLEMCRTPPSETRTRSPSRSNRPQMRTRGRCPTCPTRESHPGITCPEAVERLVTEVSGIICETRELLNVAFMQSYGESLEDVMKQR